MARRARQVEAVVPAGVERGATRYGYPPGVVVSAGDLLFVSGQVGRDDEGIVVTDGERQFATAFENLAVVLAEAGATLADVVELTTSHSSPG